MTMLPVSLRIAPTAPMPRPLVVRANKRALGTARTSTLGHKRTFRNAVAMCALPLQADICSHNSKRSRFNYRAISGIIIYS